MRIGIFYFRSLYSQSACSLSVGKFSDFLLNNGYYVKLGILKNDDYSYNLKQLDKILNNDIIIYKTNYKDFEYGIRFFENLKKLHPSKKIYLTGPFAIINRNLILKKYNFISQIFDMQNSDEVNKIFKKIGNHIIKKTVICGIDREMEIKEKGKYINLETSTGCIYNCSFCHVNLLKYPKDTISLEKLIEEIEILVNVLGKKYLIFNDSVFWKNENDTVRLKKFINIIKEKNIKFYFMIYLSLSCKIPIELLNELKSIGLIRVFFGVENISKKFQISNNKYVSEEDTIQFINVLEKRNITYHIGFILFSYDTNYEDLLENLKFLKNINKLFRPGILIEKMRILPSSDKEKILYYSDIKIDQAYNYIIKDDKVNKCYDLILNFFRNINIRYFEHFFSSINIAISILREEKMENRFINEIKSYYDNLKYVNDNIYLILLRRFTEFSMLEEEKVKLLDMYSSAEYMYMNFMNKLKKENREIYLMLPHGKEDLNI